MCRKLAINKIFFFHRFCYIVVKDQEATKTLNIDSTLMGDRIISAKNLESGRKALKALMESES